MAGFVKYERAYDISLYHEYIYVILFIYYRFDGSIGELNFKINK